MTKPKRSGPAPNVPAAEVERLIRKAKTDSTNETVSLALVLKFTVLLDKYGMEEQIQSIYNDWNKLAEEVLERRVKLHELEAEQTDEELPAVDEQTGEVVEDV